MGDTFLFSLGGTFLIIFHQYLYGWNFLILSWVAFSYGWHFHGAPGYWQPSPGDAKIGSRLGPGIILPIVTLVKTAINN